MPRSSRRARLLKGYKVALDTRSASAALLKACGVKRTRLSRVQDVVYLNRYRYLKAHRYLYRGFYRARSFEALHKILYEEGYYNDDEFLAECRLSRTAFWELLELIKQHPVFRSDSDRHSGSLQAPPEYQLLVYLKFLGTQGDGSSNIKMRNTLRPLGRGTVDLFKKRVVRALLSLYGRVVVWPSEEERTEISQRIERNYKFKYCVGLADGTLLCLEFKPLIDGEDYKTRREKAYALQMLIICDDQCRIRYFYVGEPGSKHDNTVMHHSRLYKRCKNERSGNEFFRRNEYLLLDSAFEAEWFLVPAYKKPIGRPMEPRKALFNDFVKKPRAKSEHAIGRLKGRFPQLKNLRTKIDSRKALRTIIRHVTAAVILHNLLIDDPIPEEWIDETFLELDDDDELNSQIPESAPSYERRRQVFTFLIEQYGS